MNKGDLINRVAEDANISKAQATDAVNSLFGTIGNCLKEGDKVSLVGFGTFASVHRAARMGRNPKTGASLQIAAKNVVKFKPGKELSESVN